MMYERLAPPDDTNSPASPTVLMTATVHISSAGVLESWYHSQNLSGSFAQLKVEYMWTRFAQWSIFGQGRLTCT